MFTPDEPERPLHTRAQRDARSSAKGHAVATVVGQAGTSCRATAPRLIEAAMLAQEAFWRATAEGAYQ